MLVPAAATVLQAPEWGPQPRAQPGPPQPGPPPPGPCGSTAGSPGGQLARCQSTFLPASGVAMPPSVRATLPPRAALPVARAPGARVVASSAVVARSVESPEMSSPRKASVQQRLPITSVAAPSAGPHGVWDGRAVFGPGQVFAPHASPAPVLVERTLSATLPQVATHTVVRTVVPATSSQQPNGLYRRRSLGCFQSPALTFGQYAAVEERGRQDLESFAAVWGRVWVVRLPSGELRWLKQMKGDVDGISGNGLREVAILKQLMQGEPCPNIIKLTDAFVAAGCLHLVCEHVIHDLDTYMEGRRLTAEGVRSLSYQLCNAVHHMHSRGVLHRGLKPGNVLITPAGHLVVAGFATACSITPGGELRTDYADDFFCCTALCVRPPELLLGLREYGPAVDMWALGCLIATMALGRWVFYADTYELKAAGDFESSEVSMVNAIFRRLGTPRRPHPLACLPSFPEGLQTWLPRGWADAAPLLGSLGVDLISQLLELDASLRPSAVAARQHAYFLPGRHATGPQAPEAPLDTRVCQHYLARDVADERAWQVWRITAASAINLFFRRFEGYARASLCRYVWDFLARPRCPRIDYAPALKEINVGMRAILVDWLSDVHESHHARPPVLFRTVALVDSYLALSPELPRRRFQLLGVVAFLVSCKVDREFAWGHLTGAQFLADSTANTYSAEEVTEMEKSLVACLGWPVSGWGPYHFLLHYNNLLPLPARHFHAAQCCLEGSLLDYHLSRHSSSLLGAAAYRLGAELASGGQSDEIQEPWAPELEKAAGRSLAEVRRCALELRAFLGCPEAITQGGGRRGPASEGSVFELTSLWRRFSKERYSCVAELVWPGGTTA